MATTLHLAASAAYGQTGQYIARITGRDPKYQFAREFVGRKGGKRNESTSYETDEPGLYEMRDVDRKGAKDDSYRIVYDRSGYGLTWIGIDRADALALAKRIDAGPVDWTREGLTAVLAQQEARDQDAEVDVKPLGEFGGGKIKRSEYVGILRRLLAGATDPEAEATTELVPTVERARDAIQEAVRAILELARPHVPTAEWEGFVAVASRLPILALDLARAARHQGVEIAHQAAEASRA